jgi:hypothetical protein
MLLSVALEYVDGFAGNEISEEEGDKSLIPSSTMLRAGPVSDVINSGLEIVIITS